MEPPKTAQTDPKEGGSDQLPTAHTPATDSVDTGDGGHVETDSPTPNNGSVDGTDGVTESKAPSDATGDGGDGGDTAQDEDPDDVGDAVFEDCETLPETWWAWLHEAGGSGGHDDLDDAATDEFVDAEEAPALWWEHPGKGTSFSAETTAKIGELLLEEVEEMEAAAASGGDTSLTGWAFGPMKPVVTKSGEELSVKQVKAALQAMGSARRKLDAALSRIVQTLPTTIGGGESDDNDDDDGDGAGTLAPATTLEELNRGTLERAMKIMRNVESGDEYLDAVRLSLFPRSDDGARKSVTLERPPPARLPPSASGGAGAGAGAGEETKTASTDDDADDDAHTDHVDRVESMLQQEDGLLSEAVARRLAEHIVSTSEAEDPETAYDAVTRVVGNPSLALIVADSLTTRPKPVITIASGKFGNRWGLGATIRTPVTYRVFDSGADTAGDVTVKPWCRVRVTMEREALVSEDMQFNNGRLVLELLDDPKRPRAASKASTSGSTVTGADSTDMDTTGAVTDASDGGEGASAGESKTDPAGSGTEHHTAASLPPPPGMPSNNVRDPTADDEAMLADLPLHTQLYGWGRGQYGVLGVGHDTDVAIAKPLTFGREIGLVRITKVACSWFHSLALTDMGLLYSWGNGADGALGHGTTETLDRPRLVEYFGLVHPLVVRRIAAGSDVLGAHTAVVAGARGEPTQVFSWGLGAGLGVGTSRSQWSPQVVDDPAFNEPELGGVVDLACGGGFTAAVTRSGALFTWGKSGNGRLGVGYIGKKAPKTILTPRRVTRVGGALMAGVACGEAHGVAVDRAGTLWTWGKGTSGQLGLGTTVDCSSPIRLDITEPAPPHPASTGSDVASVTSATSNLPDVRVKFVRVAAGTAHSAAIDAGGQLWTWGGAGGMMLGHGDRLLQAGVSKTTARAAIQAGARLGWKRPWLRPRRVQAMTGSGDEQVAQVACGASHTVVVASSGHLFIWGDNEYGTLGNGGRSSEQIPRLFGCSDAVSVHGSQGGMGNGLSGESILHVATCGWHTLAVSSGSFLGREMEAALPIPAGIRGVYRSCSDVLLVVERHKLPAHRVVLAARSSVLRQRLEREDAIGLVPAGSKMELVLPDLTFETAFAVLEYMYTDNISMPLTPLSPILPRIHSAAEAYNLPRLAAMCSMLLNSSFADVLRREQARLRRRAGGPPGDDDDLLLSGLLHSGDDDDDDEAAAARAQLVAGKSLATDLEDALVDGVWADTWFTSGAAEGIASRRTAAHQVILTTRSQYFKALLLGSMQDSKPTQDDGPPDEVEIDAPDAPTTLARLLHFLYTGVMSPGSTDQLLQDLVAADRFGITHLQRICESSIQITVENAARVLELADLVFSRRLREAALVFTLQNLPAVSRTRGWQVLTTRNPDLMNDVMTRIQQRNDTYYGALVEADKAAEEEAAEEDEVKEPFPWKQLALLMVLFFVYSSVSQFNVATTNVVPAINVCVLAATVIWSVRTLGYK